MTEFRNVHEFDGDLENRFNPEKDFPANEKIVLFTSLREKLQTRRGKIAVNLILFDLQNGSGNNFDDKNNIDCSDILAHICAKVIEKNLSVDFIEEQLADMVQLGRCAQGRTTRFLQIWLAIKDL